MALLIGVWILILPLVGYLRYQQKADKAEARAKAAEADRDAHMKAAEAVYLELEGDLDRALNELAAERSKTRAADEAHRKTKDRMLDLEYKDLNH